VKNRVSALMDGELDKQEAEEIIAILKKEDYLKKDWEAYHLIGDTLRQSTKLSTNISHHVNKQLISEPTILAPTISTPKYPKNKVFAYSVAASVVAMVTAWFGLQNVYVPQQTLVADQSNIESNMSTPAIMVSAPPVSTLPSNLIYQHPPAEINDYLFVHREFSPGTITRGQTTYVHPVVESHGSYGR
jgi:sigma-E factor negative regulatory protein RseA